mmetsp:Transcript_26459/g.70215  ORF Transcript_26459/g.70215 Transcript_26459/m.70215 type:complete len:240 (+) Transcript_26459:695-1414(+)
MSAQTRRMSPNWTDIASSFCSTLLKPASICSRTSSIEGPSGSNKDTIPPATPRMPPMTRPAGGGTASPITAPMLDNALPAVAGLTSPSASSLPKAATPTTASTLAPTTSPSSAVLVRRRRWRRAGDPDARTIASEVCTGVGSRKPRWVATVAMVAATAKVAATARREATVSVFQCQRAGRRGALPSPQVAGTTRPASSAASSPPGAAEGAASTRSSLITRCYSNRFKGGWPLGTLAKMA